MPDEGAEPHEERRPDRGRAVVTALGILAWIGVAQMVYLTFVELNGLIVRSQELGARREIVTALEREAEELESIVANADDLAYREALARKQGFMYPYERRVVVLSPR